MLSEKKAGTGTVNQRLVWDITNSSLTRPLKIASPVPSNCNEQCSQFAINVLEWEL